jgi:ornithine cyclodeaminase/alanine dehydrogenase-like protein (mu-crystallin family)
MLVLGAEDMVGVLDGIDVIGLVQDHHRAARWDDPIRPLVARDGDRWLCVTAAEGDDGARGTLQTSGGRGTGHRLLTLTDATGLVLAVMDADHLCRRVVAVSAAWAVAELGTGAPGAVGLIGAGSLAREVAIELETTAAPDSVRIYDVDTSAAEGLAAAIGGVVAATPAAAVAGAAVVVTATNARDPVLRADWLTEGATVIALGADRPGRRELDYRVVEDADLVVCDSPTMARTLADDLRECVAEGYLDWQEVQPLGDILAGVSEGRQGPEDRVVVKIIDPTEPVLAVAQRVLADTPASRTSANPRRSPRRPRSR